MNKTVKRVLALILAAMLMVSAFAACGEQGGSSSSPDSSSSQDSSSSEDSSSEDSSSDVGGDEEPTDTAWQAPNYEGDPNDYDEKSSYYYDFNLGEFNEYLATATSEVLDTNKRFALEAIAEAKLLEAAVFYPTYSNGARYAFGRIAPGSTTTNGWGGDSSRYQYAIVTNEILQTEHRNHLKEMLREKRGTGEYQAEAVKYLTEQGYTFKDSYNITFDTNPTTWDIQASARAGDTTHTFNTQEGLLFYDGENREVGALAESWEASEDGLTYTFKIRKGLKWVDSQGREIGDIVASDWVAGLQHTCDTGAGLGELWIDIIDGIDAYLSGDEPDFSKVGIEAPDDYTLVYHLANPVPYFLSMLHYNISFPLCKSYYESQGGKFGDEFDIQDENYLYGSDPDHIAYSGAYLITNATANNSITYAANPAYWNAENVRVHNLSSLFNDGSDATKAYNDLKASVIDQTGVSASTQELAKTEKLDGDDATIFDKYVYITSSGSASYAGFFNVNRATWANARNENEAKSTQSEEERERTHIAMNNEHFRRALATSLDRVSWQAQSVGDELAEVALRNSLTPATYVSLTEETTVEINGESKTFPAGTDYGEIMQAQLDADGFGITVWKADTTADNGHGTGDSFDGWYNPELAKAELAEAIAELESAGVTVDASNPIQIDFPYPGPSTNRTNQAQVMKKSIEEVLENKVQVNLVECASTEEWYYTGYYTERGYEQNYDIFDLSGWSPDYMDPCSYLNCFLPDYNGYMVYCAGIF